MFMINKCYHNVKLSDGANSACCMFPPRHFCSTPYELIISSIDQIRMNGDTLYDTGKVLKSPE